MDGYTGSVLRVDLTRSEITVESLDRAWAHAYLGGSGLAARYLAHAVDPSTGPRDPENALIFMTGPLCGTRSITSGRHQVVALSPLTGIFGEADVGGRWGRELKAAGFDGVVITGRSASPVYLWIRDGRAALRPAGHLEGEDTFSRARTVRGETDDGAQVACHGPAAEKGALVAGILHDGPHARAAGRCGLGAVMAGKGIRAVAVRGGGRVSVADPEGLKRVVRAHAGPLKKLLEPLRRYGTPLLTTGCEKIGSLPVRNFGHPGRWQEGAERLSGVRMRQRGLVRKDYFCAGCVIGCGKTVQVPEGPYRTDPGAGPEYETLAFLGADCMVDDLEAVCLANELCNRHGVDTMETGHLVAFAMECFEHGLISEGDCGGVAMKWGDAGAMLEMVRMICEGREVGAVLNRGLRRAAAAIGGNAADFAMHVKGLGVAGHDPRCYNGMALNYATANRGGHHMEGQTHLYETRLALPEVGHRPPGPFTVEGKGALTAFSQNMMNVLDSLKSCKFAQNGGWTLGPLSEAFRCVTGREDTVEELLLSGERAFTLKRLINVDRGISRKDDTLPRRLLTEVKTGEGYTPHLPPLETLLDEYYEVRGWSRDGIPLPETLSRLGVP